MTNDHYFDELGTFESAKIREQGFYLIVTLTDGQVIHSTNMPMTFLPEMVEIIEHSVSKWLFVWKKTSDVLCGGDLHIISRDKIVNITVKIN